MPRKLLRIINVYWYSHSRVLNKKRGLNMELRRVSGNIYSLIYNRWIFFEWLKPIYKYLAVEPSLNLATYECFGVI